MPEKSVLDVAYIISTQLLQMFVVVIALHINKILVHYSTTSLPIKVLC